MSDFSTQLSEQAVLNTAYDAANTAFRMVLATAIKGEDATNNALRTEGFLSEQASLSVAATSGNFLLPSTDVSSFNWVSVQVTNLAGGAQLTFEASLDNTNWISQNLYNITSTSISAMTAVATGATIFTGGLAWRYFRIRVSNTGTGNATGAVNFKSLAPAQQTVIAQANQQGTWNTSVSAAYTNANVSVATSSTQLLAANSSRKSVVISNLDATNPIFINLNAGTGATTSMLKLAAGQMLVIDRCVPVTAISAIATGGAVSTAVAEGA